MSLINNNSNGNNDNGSNGYHQQPQEDDSSTAKQKQPSTSPAPRNNNNSGTEKDLVPMTKKMQMPRTRILVLGLLMVAAYSQSSRSIACTKPETEIITETTTMAQKSTPTTTTTTTKTTSSFPMETDFIPLDELVRAYDTPENVTCDSDMMLVEQVVNYTAENPKLLGRKIPRVVHQTGKQKCVTETFFKGAQDWTFPGHSFYFHDDPAVYRLVMQKYWPQFPELQNMYLCYKSKGGAALSDVWRYLLVYEYGGIYTDMDNAPGPLFDNGNAIPPDADAWFLSSNHGLLSQYFFAASPKHPIMYLALQESLTALAAVPDAQKWYVPGITGPHALQRAFERFIGKNQKPEDGVHAGTKEWADPDGTNRTIHFVGAFNQTRKHKDYVMRDPRHLGQAKTEAWKKMGHENYHGLNYKIGQSCQEVIFKHHQQQEAENERLRKQQQQHLEKQYQQPN